MDDVVVITVDGPSGAGKGELCKRLAHSLGFKLLDSGAIYRVLAYAVRKAGLAFFDEESILKEAQFLNLSFSVEEDGVHVMLGREDVSKAIRTEEVGVNASKVAALESVREVLLQRQRDFEQPPGLVADGRDMGTVVFPDAQVKIFLDASAQVRAQRRVLQLAQKGLKADYNEILKDLEERDFRDRNRAVAPLKPAKGALIIDSSELDIDEVYQQAMDYIVSRLGTNVASISQ